MATRDQSMTDLSLHFPPNCSVATETVSSPVIVLAHTWLPLKTTTVLLTMHSMYAKNRGDTVWKSIGVLRHQNIWNAARQECVSMQLHQHKAAKETELGTNSTSKVSWPPGQNLSSLKNALQRPESLELHGSKTLHEPADEDAVARCSVYWSRILINLQV